MSINKLRSLVRRGSLFAAAFSLLAGALVPTLAYADALNPLTERSLTLSSSSPGWDYLDGSGNALYAPPNSGANGRQSGNTFQFKVSTDNHTTAVPIMGFDFQYCTTSAGFCTGPGNNAVATAPAHVPNSSTTIAAKTSDLDVVTSTPTELSGTSLFDTSTGNLTAQGRIPNRDNSEGNFIVLKKDVGDANWSQSSGWTMAAADKQDGTDIGTNNYITLANTSTGLTLHTNAQVKIIFFGTDTNYITNPGAGAFFVKINDFDTATTANFDSTHRIDGGVTVANVMNQSIEIQTKVLETMDFSVGTVDPDTLSHAQLSTATNAALTSHGQCDPILTSMTYNDPSPNTLAMGNEAAENSLSTAATYSTHSYWRLSSNSSAGATVYYSGATLHNTENDKIAGIGLTATSLHRGTPQFGLALDNHTAGTVGTGGTNLVDYNTERDNTSRANTQPAGVVGVPGVFENGADNTAAGMASPDVLTSAPGAQNIDSSVASDVTAGSLAYHAPQLYPLIPETDYQNGTGSNNGAVPSMSSVGYGSAATQYAFDEDSTTIPVPIASEDTQVVDCVTAKMRYAANIAATTPAGIYTTKINYIAAPQY